MKYFDKDDIRDQLLLKKLSDDDIVEAENYVDDFALSLEVEPEDIAEPVPYKVKMLAINYALMMCAKNISVMNLKGADGDDAYELKRKVYAKEVDKLEVQITADTLRGGKSVKKRAFPMSMPMYRR